MPLEIIEAFAITMLAGDALRTRRGGKWILLDHVTDEAEGFLELGEASVSALRPTN